MGWECSSVVDPQRHKKQNRKKMVKFKYIFSTYS